jgi:hypothetical protein
MLITPPSISAYSATFITIIMKQVFITHLCKDSYGKYNHIKNTENIILKQNVQTKTSADKCKASSQPNHGSQVGTFVLTQWRMSLKYF